MNNQHRKYTDKIEGSTVVSQFVESEFLPTDIAISKPINFVHLGSEVILAQDKNGLWGPIRGELKEEKDWKQALIRKTQKEIGVLIDNLTLCGYILTENNEGNRFPPKTISPVCFSYCKDINLKWVSKEMKITGREIFSHSNVITYLTERKDAEQMLEIYSLVHERIKQDSKIEFSFLPDEILNEILVTSAMVFCVDDQKRVCVVKDSGEDFYSLPGGSRKIFESSLDCAKRELREEAQITGKDFRIFGTILVTFYSKNVLVSKMQQARYVCGIDLMEEFIPHKDGFETNERKFVQINELIQLVKQFKNKDGAKIIDHLKTKVRN